MRELLNLVRFPGIRPDSLGQYLAGIGLLAAAAQKWEGVRGCWNGSCFALAGIDLPAEAVFRYLRDEWQPTNYRRWWKGCVKKTRMRRAVRKMRGGPSEPPCRGRLQTAAGCCGQKPWW